MRRCTPGRATSGSIPAPILSQATAYGRLMGCYVVNDPARMQHLAVYGLWGFVTDVPDVAEQALVRGQLQGRSCAASGSLGRIDAECDVHLVVVHPEMNMSRC